MVATWNFSEIRPGDKTREPIQGEFFTNDSIRQNGEALVREGIQNSLDAALPNETVHVRIFVSGPEFGVPTGTHCQYFGDKIWKHLQSEGNGLPSLPKRSDTCRFIVFEDFGTRGLEGDVYQYHPVAGVRNPFYHFIRAEGRSDKGEHERGRWGIGKFVFPRSSEINTILSASVRADDSRKVLIGQTILKTHKVGDKHFTPDGFYGELATNGLTLPIEDQIAFDDFCRIFQLERGNQSGLSIVIPWYDTDINKDTLLEATAIGYFYPILAGRLTVSLVTPDSRTELTSASVEKIAENLVSKGGVDITAFCRLASFACKSSDRFMSQSPEQKNSVKWHSAMLTDEQKSDISSRLDGNQIVGVRVPMVVKKKQGDNRDSHFDIFLSREPSHHPRRPVFVREGIVISDVQAPRIRGCHSLVLVEDGPLATLLGDAENPSHTRWENGSNFKDKYLYGNSYITFVTNATSELLSALSEAKQEVDQSLLSDFFFLPDDDLNNDAAKAAGKKGRKRVKLVPRIIPRNSPRYSITRLDGGFQIQGNDDAIPPDLIDIKIAYDVRRGSALKNYDAADFQLGKHGVGVQERSGVTVVSQSENRLLLQIDAVNFRCAVSGFDTERDLYIDARTKDATNDN